jgi:hypothetical protein
MDKTQLIPARIRATVVGVLSFFFLSSAVLVAETPDATDKMLSEMSQELDAVSVSKESSVRRRREFKKVIRSGEKWVESAGENIRKYEVLSLVFKAQLGLLAMEDSSRNRKALFEICEDLSQAPDEYANLRFDADMMLSERELSEKKADIQMRAVSLKELIEKYKNTPGELKSLLSAIQLAPQIDAFELKDELVTRIASRFAGHPQAIALRRSLMGTARMDVLFSGSFDSIDGNTIHFPTDRLGNPFIVMFWSEDSPNIMDRLEEIKKGQDGAPERFDIFSLNLDEIEDAGASILKKVGLKCTVLKLPGGRESEVFKTYALADPFAMRVNTYGHAIIPPTMKSHMKNEAEAKAGDGMDHMRDVPKYSSFTFPELFPSDDRVVAQIQSVMIGDFLLNEERTLQSNSPSEKLPVELMHGIRKILPSAPFRFRLSGTEVLALYRELNVACRNGIKKFEKAGDLWRLQNHQIISLMGIHNITGEERYFLKALELSREVLAGPVPRRAQVIAQFCVAKHRIRINTPQAGGVIEEFVKACGGEQTVGETVFAAACVLSMNVDSRELFDFYKGRTLSRHGQLSSIDDFISFLKSRYHNFYLFKGSAGYYLYSREYRFYCRRYHTDNGDHPLNRPLPDFDIELLNGGQLNLKEAKGEKVSVVIFVEPPPSGNLHVNSDFYSLAKEPTKRHPNPKPGGFVGFAQELVETHVNQGLELVTVFLSDDKDHISAIQKKYQWPGKVGFLSGGMDHPVVDKLGLYSADRSPNVVVLRRDRSMAWVSEGLEYPHIRGLIYVSNVALKTIICRTEVEAGHRELAKGNFKKAHEIFSGPFPVNLSGRRGGELYKWPSSQMYGKALSNIGLGKWEDALVDIDHAIFQHLKYFNHDKTKPCTSLIGMELSKARILEELGRSTESRMSKAKASQPPTNYPTYYSRIRGYNKPYELFDRKLTKVLKEMK